MGLARTAIWISIFSVGLAAEYEVEELTVYKVVDIDFQNTKIRKPCLIAQLNATIVLTYGENETVYHIPIPQDSSTVGSSCDFQFVSVLKLGFSEGSIAMTYHREGKYLPDPQKTTYCDLCDYGTWKMTKLHVVAELEEIYEVRASMDRNNLRHYAPELTEGIDIKRAFICDERDRITVIPLNIDAVGNVTSRHILSPELWRARIEIYHIQVQPFLVLSEDHFNDPYFCRSITTSLLLIILLPLIYFFIFIMFYRIKSEYGCPPSCSGPKKEKLNSNESDSCIEEESTNIMSGFSSIPAEMNGNMTTFF